MSGFTITRAHMILLADPADKKMFNLGVKTPFRITSNATFNVMNIPSYTDLNAYELKALPYGFLFTTRRFLVYLWCTIVFGLTFL